MIAAALLLASLAGAEQAAQSPAAMATSVKAYFGSQSAEPSMLLDTLQTLAGANLKDPKVRLSLEEVSDAVRDAASATIGRGNVAFSPEFSRAGPDQEQVGQALERLRVLQRTPLRAFLFHSHVNALEGLEGRYGDLASRDLAYRIDERMKPIAERLSNWSLADAGVDSASIVVADAPRERRPSGLEPPRAESAAAGARRRAAEKRRIETPDWLKGPPPVTPAMKKVHDLAATLASVPAQGARLTAARELAFHARTRPNDLEVQRAVARALSAALGRAEDSAAVAEALSEVGRASSFAAVQEIAVGALSDAGFLAQAAAVGEASTLPHVKAYAARRAR